MKKDEYGTVLNGPETFDAIASLLDTYHACLIPWTDEKGTQYDILFNILPAVVQVESRGLIQGGVRGNDLFVSIMRVGSFGFEMGETNTHWGYYAEKLKLVGDETNKKLADLINGVKASIIQVRSKTRNV